MPRTILLQNAFTSGELTPRLFGRDDLAKYQQGASCIRNYIVLSQGGVTRRAGTFFSCETKYSCQRSRLIPFEFSTTQAYMLEAGCGYIRPYKNGLPITDAAERVPNGTFDTALTGWTVTTTGTGTATWVAGAASLAAGNGSTQIAQSVAVTAGVRYTVTFRLPTVSGPDAGVFVGTAAGLGDYYQNLDATAGTYSLSIVASSNTIAFTFKSMDIFIAFTVDDVSVKAAGVVEVVTPYTSDQARALDYLQIADVLYLFHPDVPTRKLLRYGDTCWRMLPVVFTPPPTREYGARPGAEIQVGAASGNSITVTAFNCDAFINADCGREIVVTGGNNAGGRAGIASFTSVRSVVVNICEPWGSTAVDCRGTWYINGSPLAKVTPAHKSPAGQQTTLTASPAAWRTTPNYGTCGHDVGRFVSVWGGLYEITCVTSTTVARATIRGEGTAITAAQPGAWSLEEAMSCTLGYPETGTLHQDRLYTGQSYFLAGSKVSDYENFGTGILDDDAVIFAVNTNSGQVDSIRWIKGAKNLLVGTTAGELVASGSQTGPITPTNVQIDAQTTYGSNGVPPLKIGNAVLFLTRSGKRLREYVYAYEQDQWVAPDLLLLADHLTQDASIVEMAIQREPDWRIWAVKNDGVLLCCTYLRDQNVVAWSHHVTGANQDTTDGKFESVAVTMHPDLDRERVMVIVNRTINGATKRFVEYLDDSTLYYKQRFLDSSVIYNGSACAFMFGLNHLECQTVRAQVAGNDCGSFVVVNGQIGGWSLGAPIEAGLNMTSKVTTLEPAVQLNGQAFKPMRKRWVKFYAVVDETVNLALSTTCGVTVSPTWRRPGIDSSNAAPPLRSGTFEVTSGAPYNDGKLTVTQSAPYPSTILEVGGILDIGDA